MRKRGGLLALGIVLVLLSSAFALVISSQPVAAFPCCITDSDCSYDENCGWPGGWSCLFLGKCNQITSCGSYAYANECSSDSSCGSGKYCSFNTKSATVAWNHECQYLVNEFDECKTCSYPSADCNYNGGCETDLASDANNCGSCGNKCTSGWSCQSGSCKKPACIDNDGDGYGENCAKGTDCNDNNANVYPGSCSSAAVSWSSGCATSGTGGCNTGTCTRTLPSGCGDVCGDGKATGSEACDWGTGSAWGNGVWAPTWVSCPGGYDTAYGQYTCKSDCSGFEYDTSSCGKCGDGVCESPETAASCVSDCQKCGNSVLDSGEACDNGAFSVTKTKSLDCGAYPSVTQTCKSDCSGYDGSCGSCGDGTVNGPEACEAGQTKTCADGSKVSCSSPTCTWLACPSCSDGVKNQGETGVDCGGSCVSGTEVCNDGLDNDRDCQVDEGCIIPCAGPPPLCAKQQGVCSGSSKCTGSCDNADYLNYNPNYQSTETTCDNLDNDCDGSVDEGCGVCTPNQVITYTCSGCGTASQTVCNSQGTGTFSSTVNDALCTSGCPPPPDCAGVELDSSQSCCTAAGFQWVKSGEHDAGVGTTGGGGTGTGTTTTTTATTACTGAEWKKGASLSSTLSSDAKQAKLAVYGDKAYYAHVKSNWDRKFATLSIVSAKLDGSSPVKTSYTINCPSGKSCAPQAEIAGTFRVKAYGGTLYFAWIGDEGTAYVPGSGSYITVSNIYSVTVDIASLTGGTLTALSGALSPEQGKYLRGFDFAVGKDGAEYVYIKGPRPNTFDENNLVIGYDYSEGGVFSTKNGKISAWPKGAKDDSYRDYWGGPLIVKDASSTYYAWGEVAADANNVNIYSVKVGVKGSGTVTVNTMQKSIEGQHGQVQKSHLDAVAAGKNVYFSYKAQSNNNMAYNLLSFDTAALSEETQFTKSLTVSSYAAPMRLAAADSLVAAIWTEGSDSIGLTYGSGKGEFA
ncbi:hypothetical protein HYU20_00630, partial [Candidatus Woesearchaeota archaeon]|nr:hypothetical protein [Candidatus Woesearchaeota archaeon]